MEQPKTKERIALAALDLFSEYGYDGVGMELLAKRVGIKGPSIYAHYKSKEEIFETILSMMETRYRENFEKSDPAGKIPDSIEEFRAEALERINFTINDVQIKKIRRFCAKEQFRNEKIAALTSQHQLTGLQNLYTKILSGMIDKELIKRENPEILALELVSPVSLMIGIIDREPQSKEECQKKIQNYIDFFIKLHKQAGA